MKIQSVLSASFALIAMAASATAATVTFSSAAVNPADTTGSYLNNSGTLLAAVSFGPTNPTPYTYNAPGTASLPNTAPLINGIQFSVTPGANAPTGTYYALASSAGSTAQDSGRFSNVSFTNQELFGLVYNVAISSGNDRRLSLNLTSLDINQAYRLQLVFSSLNNADILGGADRSVQIAAGTFTAGANAQVGTGSDNTSAALSYGAVTGVRVVTAEFTATSNTELFTFLSGTTGSNSRVSLAGFVLTAVPEPSTYVLAAFGVVGLVLPRRRK